MQFDGCLADIDINHGLHSVHLVTPDIKEDFLVGLDLFFQLGLKVTGTTLHYVPRSPQMDINRLLRDGQLSWNDWLQQGTKLSQKIEHCS
jgi:hypothetical protein